MSRWWAERSLRAEPRTWAWLAVVALGLRVWATAAATAAQSRAAARAGATARRDVLRAALADPRSLGLGSILTLPEQIAQATRAARTRVRATLQLSILAATAVALDPLAALLLLCGVAAFAAVLRPIRRGLRRAHAASLAAVTAQVDAVEGVITHASVWAAWGGTPTVLRRTDALTADSEQLGVAAERKQALASGLNEVLAGVAIALLVGVVAPSSATARPTLLPLLVVLLSTYRPLRDLGDTAAARARGALAADTLSRLPRAEALGEARAFVPAVLELSGFGVDIGGPTARAGIDASARPGAPLVIVGPPGAGKSALLEALVGARAHHGIARYDGEPLVGPPGLGRPVAWVPPSPPTLPGTFAENLCPHAPTDAGHLARARAVLSALGDERLATLPDDTWLGPRGRTLSSGEAQRVALARAIASDRPLLVLDEPTANLDAEGEARAIEVLRAAARQRVLVLVTHRPGPLTLAASELVLRDEVQGDGGYTQRKPSLASRTTDG